MTTEQVKKQRAPRKAKTSADVDAEIKKLQAKIAQLEQKKHSGKLDDLVKSHNAVEVFNKIRSDAGDVPDTVILAAIGKAVGIPRLHVTQSERSKRQRANKVDA